MLYCTIKSSALNYTIEMIPRMCHVKYILCSRNWFADYPVDYRVSTKRSLVEREPQDPFAHLIND